MKSPFIKTLMMIALAAITSIAAAYYYPWPTPVVENANVGKPLFETFESSDVRAIRIMEFNPDKNGLDDILLRRSGEKWIIPARKNFGATSARQIAFTINSLSDRTVLDWMTDEQLAYLDYGVVDPEKFNTTPNRSAMGSKIVLEDRSGREIASLIVGKPVKADQRGLKHFVRIPGQPSVYVIDFDTRALATNFKDWVDPNLMRLTNNPAVIEVEIDNFRIPSNQLNSDPNPEPKPVSRATLKFGGEKIIEVPGKNDTWKSIAITPEMLGQLEASTQRLATIEINDVQPKDRELARSLRLPSADSKAETFGSLKDYGFVKTGFENHTNQFASENGKINLKIGDGVVIQMHFGAIANNVESENRRVGYYMMLTAGVDETIIPEPEKPADPQDKEYLRKLESRKGEVQQAMGRASELNQLFADWYYVIPEDLLETLRPSFDLSNIVETPPVKVPSGEAPSGETPPEKSPPRESSSDEATSDESTPDKATSDESSPDKATPDESSPAKAVEDDDPEASPESTDGGLVHYRFAGSKFV